MTSGPPSLARAQTRASERVSWGAPSMAAIRPPLYHTSTLEEVPFRQTGGRANSSTAPILRPACNARMTAPPAAASVGASRLGGRGRKKARDDATAFEASGVEHRCCPFPWALSSLPSRFLPRDWLNGDPVCCGDGWGRTLTLREERAGEKVLLPTGVRNSLAPPLRRANTRMDMVRPPKRGCCAHMMMVQSFPMGL